MHRQWLACQQLRSVCDSTKTSSKSGRDGFGAALMAVHPATGEDSAAGAPEAGLILPINLPSRPACSHHDS